MKRWYVDSSAAVKLLTVEAETTALENWIVDSQPYLLSCYLLETELRRTAFAKGIPQIIVTELLDDIDLYEVPAELFRNAGFLTTLGLRSLDAIHLAAAQRLQADGIITYDTRMTRGAEDLGFRVIAPH